MVRLIVLLLILFSCGQENPVLSTSEESVLYEGHEYFKYTGSDGQIILSHKVDCFICKEEGKNLRASR